MKLVPGGAEAEAKQALENLSAILDEANTHFSNGKLVLYSQRAKDGAHLVHSKIIFSHSIGCERKMELYKKHDLLQVGSNQL